MTTSHHPTAVLLAVGLTESLISEACPRIQAFLRGGRRQYLEPSFPAVTTTVQSSMLTGAPPREHGIVGNGWYNREMAEVQFWKQSNHLVERPKVWEIARERDPSCTTLNMFWWYNMYSSVDFSVTPRPIYKADGRKIPDCYSHPQDLRDELQAELDTFPLFNFWGPASSIKSTQWIADATVYAHRKHRPGLTLVYLPHLDYCLQKLGPEHPDIPKYVAELDAVVGQLLDYFEGAGVRPMIASEYGIMPVDDAVHPNRILREAGAISLRVEEGLELLDAGASDAFAVADHQCAHVYVKDPGRIGYYAELLRGVPGVERVLDRAEQAALELDHPRSGDLVLLSEPRRWFSYYYWLDDARAPDFARCVDIHRKPGYDPVELFLNPALKLPPAHIAWRLLKKKLGFRTLMDLIPLDTALVRGSHGRHALDDALKPLLLTSGERGHGDETLPCTAVRDAILQHLFAP
ncbi:MAG: alkaline phosphatase family protein [Candidatus Hydrogenedentes bacterium]|nr:alkaline phosphatase family protein [Candidatus Hydrogenedentota bacterium]